MVDLRQWVLGREAGLADQIILLGTSPEESEFIFKGTFLVSAFGIPSASRRRGGLKRLFAQQKV